MKVYMLQDAVTGDFYRPGVPINRQWGPQKLGTVWAIRRTVEAQRASLKPLYTTVIRVYTLKSHATEI